MGSMWSSLFQYRTCGCFGQKKFSQQILWKKLADFVIFWNTASVVQQALHILDDLVRSIQKRMDCPDRTATFLRILQTENVFHTFTMILSCLQGDKRSFLIGGCCIIILSTSALSALGTKYRGIIFCCIYVLMPFEAVICNGSFSTLQVTI